MPSVAGTRAGRPRTAPRTAPRTSTAPHGSGAPGRPLSAADLRMAGLVAVVAAIVAFWFRSALVPTDPWHYVQGAIAFPEPTWRPAGMTRWGFVLPIVPFAKLWGDATATYYVIPLVSTALLAGVLYLLGARAVSRAAGLLACGLALGTPLVFVNLTRGYADLTATALVATSVLLATVAADRAGLPDGNDVHLPARLGGRRDVAWQTKALLLGSGLALGWAIEVRETALFAAPAVVLALWPVRRPIRRMLWFAAPIGAWALLDLLLCTLIYGDPLVKISILAGADISSSVVSSDAGYVGHSRFWYAFILPRSIWQVSGGPALLVCLLVGIVGGAIFWRQLGRIWLWGVLALGLLWIQGGPFDPQHPSVRLDVARYWLSFIVPLMVCAVGAALLVVRRARPPRRFLALVMTAVMVCAVALPAARFARSYPGLLPNGGDAMAQLRDHLAQTQQGAGRVVWADWGTQRILPAYQNWAFGGTAWEARRVRSLNRLLHDERRGPREGDLIVVYSQADRTCWHCRRALRHVESEFGPFPASGWEPLFVSSAGNLTLYRVGPDAVWASKG